MTARRYTAAIIAAILGVAACAASTLAQQGPTRAQREAKLIAVLQSDAPLFDKTKACQQLAVVGSARAVPVLAGLLGHERLGDYARTALEPIDHPSVDEAVRRAAGKLKGTVLIGVVNSIGIRRDAKAVGQLDKLARDRSSGASREALVALGRIATVDAIKTLTDVLASGPAELRPAAADAALVGAERLLTQKKTAAAGAVYTAIDKADVDEQFKTAAAYHAIVARGPAGAPQLVAHLRSEKRALRRVALRAARAMPGREVTAALAAELSASPPPVQVALIGLLAERGGPGVQKPIIRAVGHDDGAVRKAALKALGEVGDASAVDVLVKALQRGAKADQAAAVASLRIIRGKGVDETIVRCMDRADNTEAPGLIGIVAARQYRPATKVLLVMASGSSTEVSIAAFKALGALAGSGDMPAIIKALDSDHDASVHPHAEQAIAFVARRIADPAARADAVLAALAKTGKKPVRCSLIRALGGIGGAKACAVVARAVGDDDAAIKEAAVRSLVGWPDTHAAPPLLEIVKTTKSTTHRVLALRGYVRLLGLGAAGSPAQAVRTYAEAMGLATRPAEKKLVLSGLASVSHADAIKIVLPHLDDAAVRDEAALAAVSIARATMGADRAQVRAAMVKVQAAVKGTAAAAAARRIVAQINKFADAITAWRVTGPYTKAGLKYDKLFDVVFAPETAEAKGVTWQALPAGTDPKRPWILDLRKFLGGDQRVAYVLTWVHSAAAQPARLELGTDDGVKAWLNGKLVHANNVARAAVPYTDKVPVKLQAGWNPLMLKITQNQIPWEFCARLAHPRKGGTLEGIRIDCMHEGDWRLPAAKGRPTRH